MPIYKKSAEMRKNIMEATQQLVLEQGYGKTSVKDITQRLGIPRSLLYYYFKNKDDIMLELYRTFFAQNEELASKALPWGEQPLVRLMLKYILFRRRIAYNSLFTEFIITSPDYAVVGVDEAAQMANTYYSDSCEAFRHCGLPLDGEEFQIHVLMTESVSRALFRGEYYNTVHMTERKSIECFAEHTVMLTFNLDKAQMRVILDQAFAYADQIEAETAP